MNEKTMVDKKFYGLGIVLGIVSLVGSITISVVGLLVGILGMILNIKNKDTYRVKIGIVLNSLGVILSVAFILFIMWTQIMM